MKPWYQPNRRTIFDGAEWSTDGHVAYRETAPPECLLISGEPLADHLSLLDGAKPVTFAPANVTGCLLTSTGATVQAHHISRAERLFGAVEWAHATERMPLGSALPLFGRAGGRVVAFVMPVREGAGPTKPRCPDCKGQGKAPCSQCDGTGRIECTCQCGHEHDNECPACDGDGGNGACVTCNGTGRGNDD